MLSKNLYKNKSVAMRTLGGEGTKSREFRLLFVFIVGFVSWITISSSRLLPSATYDYSDNHYNSPSLHSQQLLPPLHASFALSGKDPGLLAEFEASLKSVLLNAPLERKLFIHILADDKAYLSLEGIFNRTELVTWITRNQIEIHAHDITPQMKMLRERIKDVFQNMGPDFVWWHAVMVHTVGTWFRLIAHLVIPSLAEHLLYIDTDVVVMANLEGLMKQVQRKPDALFHWGKGMNAGFIVMNVNRMEDIWTLARESPLKNISEQYKQRANDQLIFMSVNVTHPNEVNILDPGWEMVNTLLWGYNQNLLDKLYPDTGMLHINGGGFTKNGTDETFFEQTGGRIVNHPTTWGNAKYYVTLPWTWARYQARNLVRVGSNGYPLKICSWGTAKSNNMTLHENSVSVQAATKDVIR